MSSRLDQIKTKADYRAYCRDHDEDEDASTARELITNLRLIQSLEAHPANRAYLWQNAQKMIDDAAFTLVVLVGLTPVLRVGWLIGCAALGGDPTR